nr:G protein-coupled receptor [Proales similis]
MKSILWFSAILVAQVVGEICIFDLDLLADRPNLDLTCRINKDFSEMMDPFSTAPSNLGFFFNVQRMYIYPNEHLILDSRLSLAEYFELLTRNNLTNDRFHYEDLPRLYVGYISFTNIKGQDINSSYSDIGPLGAPQSQLNIEFDYSHFLPFSNGRALVNDCDMQNFELEYISNLTPLLLDRLIFQTNTRYYPNVCAIIFRHASMFRLDLLGISSSNLGLNLPTFDFLTENGTMAELNATIHYALLNLYLQSLDSSLLNRQILEKLIFIEIDGKLDRIEPCIFEFYNKIGLNLVNMRTFLHLGINWCPRSTSSNETFFMTIRKYKFEGVTQKLTYLANEYTFPAEDICIFRSLLSDGRHFFQFDAYKSLDCTCSVFWLVLNYNQNLSQEIINELYSTTNMFSICTENKTYDEWMEECDFDNRFAKCDLNQSTRAEAEWTAFETTFLMAGLKYALAVVLLPVVCVIGLVTSCLSIAVLRKMIAKLAEKRYDDTSKRSRLMYSYLLQHAVGSAAVCALFAFKPLTECVSYGGIYCSPVYSSWQARLFDAIGVNMLGTALKLHTTLTALLFSLARLAINVKNKERSSARIFSKMQPAYVSFACLLFFLAFSGVKLFTSNDYSALSLDSDTFRSFRNPRFSFFKTYYFNFSRFPAFYYLNLSLEVLLDLVLPLFTVIVDLILLLLMRKQNANRSKISQHLQTKSEENEKQFTKMIVFNGIFNFSFRLPVFGSNVVEFIVYNEFGTRFFNFEYCQFTDYPSLSLCPTVLSISNLFLQTGFIIDFLLLLRFNRDFRQILRQLPLTRIFWPTQKP